jgi:hypothetical protein
VASLVSAHFRPALDTEASALHGEETPVATVSLDIGNDPQAISSNLFMLEWASGSIVITPTRYGQAHRLHR